ncbi:MAG: hypothetical protein KC503_28235 [Myxococcales bacterium]|nr:hypothetical protein [Myxococcales bacterium]
MSTPDDNVEPARDAALEAAIVAAPAALEPTRVYCDWLCERGDVRGELMAIQLQRELCRDAREERRLAVEQRELIERHYLDLFGRVASSGQLRKVRLVWRRGLVRAAELWLETGDGFDEAERMLAAVQQLPSAIVLERVLLSVADTFGAFSGAIGRVGLSPCVRELVFDSNRYREGEVCWELMQPGIQHVERLDLCCERVTLPDKPRLLQARSLSLRLGSISCGELETLGRLEAPELVSLSLAVTEYHGGRGWLGTLYAPLGREVVPLLRPAGTPALRELELRRLRRGDEVIEALVGEPWPALEQLGLVSCRVTDQGVALLCKHAATLGNIARLDLRRNAITAGGRLALRRAFGERVLLGGNP